ncbi:hypothetical protein [Flammeovirga sp. SubArs3]|uniref:hypothetical protein n=1 Tax=Flammeovirga sp. SubArs3 TaxID=2995316 RepID=UPI00248BCDB5|nr:hypothetical protein [Flammeovirga sp. SubArs3]
MAEERTQIIQAIEKPINFLVLILLMVETLLGTLVLQLETHRNLLIYTIIGFFIAYTLLIIIIAYTKPEVLQGKRSWKDNYAQSFADDIYVSLEGYLSNLEEGEEYEAWLQLSDIINDSNSTDMDYSSFRSEIANRIVKRVDQRRNIESRRGTIN